MYGCMYVEKKLIIMSMKMPLLLQTVLIIIIKREVKFIRIMEEMKLQRRWWNIMQWSIEGKSIFKIAWFEIQGSCTPVSYKT